VLVQSAEPLTGERYNILFVTVRNSTARTFGAESGLAVRLSGQRNAVPILRPGETWRPGEVLVFYVLTKKYYPVNSVTSGGFEFNIEGSRGVAIPGPSGIFQRIIYNPATFPRLLDGVVAFGPGSRGRALGLPDTALWEIVGRR
jgi:hypothetical protein